MNIEEIKILAKRFQGYADASNVAGFISPEVDEVARILPELIRGYEMSMQIDPGFSAKYLPDGSRDIRQTGDHP